MAKFNSIKNFLCALVIIILSHNLFAATASVNVASETYKRNVFTKDWDIVFSADNNLIGGNTNYATSLSTTNLSIRIDNLDYSTNSLTQRLDNLDISTSVTWNNLSSTYIYSSQNINNLHQSTANLTVRLDNLDLSTSNLTSRLNNLDYSTSVLFNQISSTYIFASQNIYNLHLSTQNLTVRLNNLDVSTQTIFLTKFTTHYIQNTDSLQPNSSFYVLTGTLNKNLNIGTTLYTDHINELNDGHGVFINNHLQYSNGILYRPIYIDNGDGTITIGTTSAVIQTNSDYNGGVKFIEVATKTLTLTQNSLNYLTISWNNGSPEYQLQADRNLITQSDIIPVFRVFAKNNEVEYLMDYGIVGKGNIPKNNDRLIRLRGIEKEDGIIINSTSSTNLNVTGGYIWFGLRRHTVDAFFSSSTVSCDLDLVSYNNGAWTSHTRTNGSYTTDIYQTEAGTQTLTAGRYAVIWAWRQLDTCEVDFTLGAGDYTLAQAEAELSPPSFRPTFLDGFYIPFGKIIIKKGDMAPFSVETYDSRSGALLSAGITDHSFLSNLGLTAAGHPYDATGGFSSYDNTLTLINSTYTFAAQSINSLHTSTSNLTIRLNNLDLSTQNISNRTNNLDLSTYTLTNRLNLLDSSTQTLTNRLNDLNVFRSTAQTKIDGLVLFKSTAEGKIDSWTLSQSSISSMFSSISASTKSYSLFVSTAQQKIEGLNLFKSTAEVKIDSVSLFKSTAETTLNGLTLFRSTAQTTIDGLTLFRSTAQTKIDSFSLFKTTAEPKFSEISAATTSLRNDVNGFVTLTATQTFSGQNTFSNKVFSTSEFRINYTTPTEDISNKILVTKLGTAFGDDYTHSFTTTRSGYLRRVDVYFESTDPAQVYTLQVKQFDFPRAVYSTAITTFGATDGYVSFNFNDPYNVQAGTKYNLRFYSTSTTGTTYTHAKLPGDSWGTQGDIPGTYTNRMTFFIDEDINYLNASSGTVNIGSGTLVVTPSGNVGIGKVSPSKKLDVFNGSVIIDGDGTGESTSAGTLSITGDNGKKPWISLVKSGDSGFSIGADTDTAIIGWDSNAQDLQFRSGVTWNQFPTDGTLRIIVKPTGAVGIGTDSPQAGLHVSTGGTTAGYGISQWPTAVLGVNTTVPGALKLHGGTAGGYGIIQETTNNLHLDTVGGNLYLNYYDGDNIYFGNGASGSNGIFTGSGNFGIGTTSPANKLEVYGGSITITNTVPGYAVGSESILTFRHGTADMTQIRSYLPGSNDGDMRFYTKNSGTWNTTPNLSLSGDGLTGIGGAPDSASMLTVYGITQHKVDGGDSYSLYHDPGNFWASSGLDTSEGAYVIANGNGFGSPLMAVKLSGNVGVGTIAPSAPFHIFGASTTLGDNGQFLISNPVDAQGYYGGLSMGYDSINHWAWLYSRRNGCCGTPLNLNSSIYANYNGSVGVGIASPIDKFHVYGGSLAVSDAQGSGFLYGYDRNHGIHFRQGGANRTGYYSYGDTLANQGGHRFFTGGSKDAQTEKLRISDDGTYFLGAAGGGTLAYINWVSGINLQQSTNGKHLYINRDSGSSTNLYLGRSGAETTILAGGNVGIGNTAPRQKLDVTGNITTDWTDGRRIGMDYLDGSQYRVGMDFNASNRTTNIYAYSSDTSEEITFSLGTPGSPSEKMRIETGGNVGIGTNDPVTKLHVAGDLTVDDRAYGVVLSTGQKLTVANTWYDIKFSTGHPVLQNITHSLTSNPERITVAKAGTYLIQYKANNRTQGVDYHMTARLVKNGTTELEGSFTANVNSNGIDQGTETLVGETMAALAANDYITLQMSVTNAGTGGGNEVQFNPYGATPTWRNSVSLTLIKLGP